MLHEIEIASRGDTLKLLPPERKVVFYVNARAGVVREFVWLLPIFDETGRRQSDEAEEFLPLFDPVLVPYFPAPVILHRAIEIWIVRELHDATVQDFHRFVRPDEEL